MKERSIGIKRNYLTNKNFGLYIEILKIAIPIILMNLLQTLYALADSYYMGKLGKVELAVAAFTLPIAQIVGNLGSGFSIGGGYFLAKAVGAKKTEEFKEIATQLLIVNLTVSIILSFISNIFSKNILILSAANGELLNLSEDYIKIIFLTLPFSFLINTYTTIENSKGNTKKSLTVMIISTSLNVILNHIAIFNFGMKIKGLALATLISQIVTSIYCITELIKKNEIKTEKMKIDTDMFKKIVKLGIPASISASAASLSFILVNVYVVKYGTEVLAAFGIGNRINNIFFMISSGIGSALSIIIGQYIGAEKNSEIMEAIKKTVILGILISLVGMGILYFYTDSIVSIFTNNLETARHSSNYLYTIIIGIFPWAIFQILIGVFQGTGQTKYIFYCNVSRIWLFRIPFIIAIEKFLVENEYSIWLSMVLSNITATILSIVLFMNIRRKIKTERNIEKKEN